MKFRFSFIVFRLSLGALSAALLTLSFPPFNLWLFAWTAFIPLFFALENQKPLAAFSISYLAGFLFFLGTIHWLAHVSLPGMLIVAAYLALYFGFFGLIVRFPSPGLDKSIAHNRPGLGKPNYKLLLLIPAAWTALEWARSHVFTGFGWALLGYSQSGNLPIIQIADIFGAYGVSFVIVMFNAAVYLSIKNIRSGEKKHLPLAAAALFLLTAFTYGAFRLNSVFTGEKLRVAIVQGNIPQDEKWDRNFTDSILSKYADLTKKASPGEPDLVIWPETSIPGFVENEKDLSSAVGDIVAGINTPLLAGAPRYKDTESGISYYNSAFLFPKDNAPVRHYDKIHLVPFGEYVPLKNLFFFVHKFAPRPIGDFAGGREFTVLSFLVERSAKEKDRGWRLTKKINFGCLICFEDIFPELARGFVKNNAGFLVNMTNDAWFGRSSAAYQHAQASVFRAVENRINVVRAANTGLSCFIDQKGRIVSKVSKDGNDLFVDGFDTHEIVLSRIRTLYTTYGDVFAYICIFFTVWSITRRMRKVC